MTKSLAILLLCTAVSAQALAQQTGTGSSTTHMNTPAGPVIETKQTTPTLESKTYTPGNNTSVQPTVGTTTYYPPQRTEPTSTNVTVGISIPLDSTPKTSTSTAPPAPASSPDPE